MSFKQALARIGLPQIAALILLTLFLLQCLWFVEHVPLTAVEGTYLEGGLLHLEHLQNAASVDRSPLIPLLAGWAARLSGGERHITELTDYRLAIRLPFVLAGVLLGASLWYVARRLYGNYGGYIALGLYCFSPMMITHASQVQPEIFAAWGAFGLIFTAIAVAHTLYAPREVVLWNWRRIAFMGVAITVCIGSQFSLWIVLVVALAFMLWVGHVRPAAALAIFLAACGVALVLLFAIYGFRPAVFVHALGSAAWFEFSGRQLASRPTLLIIKEFLLQNGLGPALLMLVALIAFLAWKKTRYFGTAAPLITAVVLLAASAVMQHLAGFLFLLVALPFLLLFVAGVFVDLLESRALPVAATLVTGVLLANAFLNLYGLWRILPK